MSNFIVNTDVPNLRVLIRNGDDYNVRIVPSSITTERTGSFQTYADLAGQVVTASYALVAQTVIGSIESSSYSFYAVTASYVSGAASSWNDVANKPDGLVSSSAQATTWTVASSSIATSSSFATTASYAANADLFDGRNSTTFASTGSNTFVGNQTITGSITISGSISAVDYIDINTTATPAGAVGRLQWDDGNGTAILGLKGGNTSLQLGQEVIARVYNNDTVPLTDGMIVYITGAQGNRVAVKRASANAEFGSANTLGMVTEPIAIGAEGFITLVGVVNNLNTIGLTPGALLWLSTGSGQYTQTRPEAPAHGVSIGYVERVHASVGSIFVKVDNGYELDELHNVNDTSTTSSYGDLLVKSGSIWVNSKQLTGSYGLTGSFTVLGTISGSVTLPSGVVSSSAQASSWTVATASIATSASFALTASYVSGAVSSWDTISGKPSGLVSSSAQINTGSFTGSFTGALVGTSSWAVSSSLATTASFAVSASFAPTILPTGVVSSSAQINTGSFTGSFVGTLTGTASFATSASFAPTILPSGVVSSSAQAVTWTVATASVATSASFALTASYVSGAASTWDTITGKPSGLVSSSAQINTGSFTGSFTGTFVGTSSWASNVTSASFATSASRAVTSSFAVSASFAPLTLPTGVVSSSAQINTGSFTGSFTGTFIGTSSWASNAVSSSFATTASFAVSSSRTVTASFATSASFAPTVLPLGVVSSSTQINTGSFTGSFVGTLTGTSSWAQNVISASYALSSSLATSNILTASVSNTTITFTKGDGTQFNLQIAQSGSVESASYATLAGSTVSASYAVTASFAPLNLPSGTVSSSAQINTGSFTGSFTGVLTGTGSWASNAISASFATSASFAPTILPSGTVSSSTQITVQNTTGIAAIATTGSNTFVGNQVVTGSLLLSSSAITELRVIGNTEITGSLNITSGGVTGSVFGTSSWAVSSSRATTASFAVSASFAPTILPTGTVSSSVQINTGSFTGSFTGTFSGTSSWASNSITASVAEQLTKQTITFSSSISPTWATITSASQHLNDGTYAVTANITATPLINLRVSGIFSWYTGSVSVNDTDEIFLQRNGGSSGTASIFMRTQMISASASYLQIASDYTLPIAQHTFTLVKLI